MPRRFGARRHRRTSRSSRKTYWEGAVWQGQNILFAAGSPFIGGPYTWVSFWIRYPSGSVDPSDLRVVPSDETLARLLIRGQLSVQPGTGNILDIVLGVLAFDGGDFPDFYEQGVFTSNVSLVAPPNPIVDPGDDWIIRQPIFSVTATGLQFAPLSVENERWTESRAMRKLPPNTGLLAVLAPVNVLDLAPTQALNWSFDFRYALRSGYTR